MLTLSYVLFLIVFVFAVSMLIYRKFKHDRVEYIMLAAVVIGVFAMVSIPAVLAVESSFHKARFVNAEFGTNYSTAEDLINEIREIKRVRLEHYSRDIENETPNR